MKKSEISIKFGAACFAVMSVICSAPYNYYLSDEYTLYLSSIGRERKESKSEDVSIFILKSFMKNHDCKLGLEDVRNIRNKMAHEADDLIGLYSLISSDKESFVDTVVKLSELSKIFTPDYINMGNVTKYFIQSLEAII